MNNVIEMMNQSTLRLRKISEGDYNEFVTKSARRQFGMQIEILCIAIRGYLSASKDKPIIDVRTLIDYGLGDSEVESIQKQIDEKIKQCGELMDKIKENHGTVEMEEALRERKLQIKLFGAVNRASLGAFKNKNR